MDAVGLAGGVDGNDVGVMEPAGGLRLAPEPLHRSGCEPQPAAQQLEGHRPIEGDLARPIDDAHAPSPQFMEQLEIAEDLGRLSHGGRIIKFSQVSPTQALSAGAS